MLLSSSRQLGFLAVPSDIRPCTARKAQIDDRGQNLPQQAKDRCTYHKSLGDMRCNVYYTLLGRRRIKGLAQLKKFTPFYLLNGTIVISGEFELNFQKIVGRPPQGGEKISVMTKDHFKILARKIWRLQKLL
jgi:hypothetical protein